MLRASMRFVDLTASICGTAPRLRAVRTALVCSWRAHAAAATALCAELAPCLACSTDQRMVSKQNILAEVRVQGAHWTHLTSHSAGPAFGKHGNSHEHRQLQNNAEIKSPTACGKLSFLPATQKFLVRPIH